MTMTNFINLYVIGIVISIQVSCAYKTWKRQSLPVRMFSFHDVPARRFNQWMGNQRYWDVKTFGISTSLTLSSHAPSGESDFEVVKPVVELQLAKSFPISFFLNEFKDSTIRGVYAIINAEDVIQYVGSSLDVYANIKEHHRVHGPLTVSSVQIQTFLDPSPPALDAYKGELIRQTNPWGNAMGVIGWDVATSKNLADNELSLPSPPPTTPPSSTNTSPIKEALPPPSSQDPARNLNSRKLSSLQESLAKARALAAAGSPPPPPSASSDNGVTSPFEKTDSVTATPPPSESPSVTIRGGTDTLEFTRENVDKVLDEIRPYLIADGGNVAVVGVDPETRSVQLTLQGACGSCASSTTTMKMGIERVLQENFSNLGPVISVNPDSFNDMQEKKPISEPGLTVDMINEAMAKILPAVQGMGGSVVIESVDPVSGTVYVNFKGPSRLKMGIELVLKDLKLVKNVEMRDIAV